MSVDKFGHFNSYKKEILKKDVHKWAGYTVDKYKNIDIHNKRIKNVANALDDKDVVNKEYLFLQICNEQKILKNGINGEIIRMREEISQLKNQLKSILEEKWKRSDHLQAIYINRRGNDFQEEEL